MLDRARLSLAEKIVASAARDQTGDLRPWDDVVEWARWIAAALVPAMLATEVSLTADGVLS